MEEREYFLYRHINPIKNEVFYIGIGTANLSGKTLKKKYARAFLKSKRSKFWQRTVSKYGYEIEIIFKSKSRDEIENKEKEFINIYGRSIYGGTLTNLTAPLHT